MVFKIISGWMIIILSYFVTLYVMFAMYPVFFNEPTDHNWDLSGTFIGIPLIIIPYLIGGYFTRLAFANKRSGALWVSIVPVISERLLIYLSGYLLVLAGGDGSTNGITTMMFIRGEAAPYFSYTYIFCGVISVLICLMVATYKSKVRSE